ncbi:endonuclease domain-containing 1 -like protein [Labeo rohita]|uniref:Endonuclease domain-containing 1-like protein n=1 Tax=Labeo rohita TaxID=84645 RepID=A0A498LYA3_LABRO|nr:endonuclease domain-containing 1 -like protein [Labeo rohita]
MFVLALLISIMLGAFSAQAKVVPSFDECKGFFYKDTEPGGMDQNAKKICQMLQFDSYHYATLYSVHHRIPLYSAYIFDPDCSSTAGRTDNWHVEPQISYPRSRTDFMVLENQNEANTYKQNQAISSDYSDTGYDRGHLYPSSFRCGEERKATFTLTNAAPMDACFNRIHWKNWESALRTFLLQKHDWTVQYDVAAKLLSSNVVTVYIVTGTVPSANERIPHRGTSEDPERVTVPSHIWTAVCYKHQFDDKKSFSFGYIGNNLSDGRVTLMLIPELEKQLSELYSEVLQTVQSINIFADYCFSDKRKLDEVQPTFQKLIDLQVSRAVRSRSDIQNMVKTVKRALRTDTEFTNNFKVTKMTAELAFDSMSSYHTVTEDLKRATGSSCLITYVSPQKEGMTELRKRGVSEFSDAVKCQLFPEKQINCSSPCLYHDHLKSYKCYTGSKQFDCSPQYSLITATGVKCQDNYPCAKYNTEYYQCKTSSGEWEYCSPPLWRSRTKNEEDCRNNHACANYGKTYTWCYTDDEDSWDYCCASDDCNFTVSGKTYETDILWDCFYKISVGPKWVPICEGNFVFDHFNHKIS